jgi:hypothetical protein
MPGPAGARVAPLSEYAAGATVYSSWELSDDQRAAIVAAGRALVGTRYSVMDYFALAAHRLHLPLPGLKRYVENSGHMICSQLVDEAYFNAGLVMFADGRWPGYVVPASMDRVLTGPLKG